MEAQCPGILFTNCNSNINMPNQDDVKQDTAVKQGHAIFISLYHPGYITALGDGIY